MENWIPGAVALVTSGSRGNRLLFYHTGKHTTEGKALTVVDLHSGDHFYHSL